MSCQGGKVKILSIVTTALIGIWACDQANHSGTVYFVKSRQEVLEEKGFFRKRE